MRLLVVAIKTIKIDKPSFTLKNYTTSMMFYVKILTFVHTHFNFHNL